ncbi:protein of unknown function [Methylocaldum szegediense]|uniref:Uncharacterized protein n=1 Tax=Methylocaldum szegediense TaxID=73780 RepID=A0ABN8X293_9GAMM|nr:protein of unknown function [Methylocaldum szegediense]
MACVRAGDNQRDAVFKTERGQRREATGYCATARKDLVLTGLRRGEQRVQVHHSGPAFGHEWIRVPPIVNSRFSRDLSTPIRHASGKAGYANSHYCLG